MAEEHDCRLVEAEWTRRTQAEYTSAAIAHGVTLWLIQAGAPPDLIRDGLRVVDDELVHSERSAEVSAAAGARQATAATVIDRATLVLPTAGDPLADLLAAIVRFFCVGETVAVPLFRMLRCHSTVPIARTTLDRVLRDEVRHRQFGWDVLDWILLAYGEPAARHLAREAPAAIALVADAYVQSPADGPNAGLSPAAEAWGLAPIEEYAATVMRAIEADVRPRFAARITG